MHIKIRTLQQDQGVLHAREGGANNHPAPLGLEVEQLQGVRKVCPGCGAPDHNGCCVVCPSSLQKESGKSECGVACSSITAS